MATNGSDDWDSALNRLLEGVNLDDLNIPLSSDAKRIRLTFDGVRDRVADQMREKIRSERLRREAIAAIMRQFDSTSLVIEQSLGQFVGTLLGSFHGGGEVRRLPEPRDGRTRTWQVLAHRAPGRAEGRDPIITVTLGMRGLDALDRGQPSLECRTGTPRNPRLLDFVPGSEIGSDIEDAICRAYQDILGTLRFDPIASDLQN